MTIMGCVGCSRGPKSPNDEDDSTLTSRSQSVSTKEIEEDWPGIESTRSIDIAAQ